MNDRRRDPAPGQAWVDIDACTLPAAIRPLRLAELDDLFATSLRSIERAGDTSVRMVLSGDANLAGRARRLAEAESSCCSFFTFTVARLEGGQVSFSVAVPAEHVDVLTALVARAESTMSGTS